MLKKKILSLIVLLGFIMSTTSPVIVLTFGNAELSAAISSDSHDISIISDLVTGGAKRSRNYATLEPNGWLLDGNAGIYNHPQHVGFVSDDISNGSGVFSSPPEIRLRLDSVVDIEKGITFEFNAFTGDYANDVDIEYRNIATALIASESHTPDGYNYFCEVGAVREDVKYIDITFNGVNANYRHLRLLGVYVDGVMWDKENIQSANIVEEIDQISVTSPSNELTFSLYSNDGDFSIVDPQGVYAYLERGQKLDAYEMVDDKRIYMGRFYLQNWKSKNENLAEFESLSPLGKLELETSYGRAYSPNTGWSAEDVMDCIMGNTTSCSANDASEIEYEIDADLANIPVSGWLPVQTRREALKQLAFAIGGYLDDTRGAKVVIRPIKRVDDISTFDFELDNSNVTKPDVDLKSIITGIRITSHTFEKVLYSGGDYKYFADDVVAGDYLFAPKSERIYILGINYTDTTATIDSSTTLYSSNFTKFTVTGAGYLVLEKQVEYIKNSVDYTLTVHNLPAGTPENIIVIENATLVNPDNVAEVALRVLEYYQQQYALETKLFASEIAVGNSAKIDTQSNKQFGGICEKMEFDLAGGFMQQIKARGAILPYTPTWYGVEYLMLGGGGAGASHSSAGGGGAGELIHGIDLLGVGVTYAITVGAGGVGSSLGSGTNGSNTIFNEHSALGGGHGALGSVSSSDPADDGADGGCGGGGGGNSAGYVDGSGGDGRNFGGGDGSNGSPNYGGGGGGGCSEEGSHGVVSDGGSGKSYDITGSAVYYGGGGGGIGLTRNGSGGVGGGGNGNRTGAGVAGVNSLGAGGGASNASYAGGRGGKGVVILRILTTKYTGTTTGSPTVTTDGDYTVLKYNSSGSYTA